VISVELNTALKSHLNDLEDSRFHNLKIFPLTAYDDVQSPFLLYMEYSGTQSEEQWFLKVSNVMYYIYDTDISRMKDIGHEIEQFFNVGDNIADIRGKIVVPSQDYGPLRYRLMGSRKVAGSTIPPIEREGFAAQLLNFRVVYVDV
jgi:hypothetical protein